MYTVTDNSIAVIKTIYATVIILSMPINGLFLTVSSNLEIQQK